MKHIKDIELIALLEKHLAPAARSAVERHLSDCQECRMRKTEIAETWDILGTWDLQSPQEDLCESILARSRQESKHKPIGYLRIAASIIAAVGIGYIAGQWIDVNGLSGTNLTQSQVEIDEQDVAENLGLAALDNDSYPGIAEAILNINDSEEGN